MFSKIAISVALGALASRVSAAPAWKSASPYKYVFTVSPDGLHASDIPKYVAMRPNSNISMLLQTGVEYTDAYTSAPSDSFPGTCAQFTGGGPKTTGVWYDDIWVRDLYPIGSDCIGPIGTDTDSTEDLDYNKTLLFSGGINPANLPLWIQDGQCVSQYPHSRLRVNTAFEVLVSHGLQTAYTDKHPAYDLVRGPSGTGLTTGYFPEIEAIPGSNVSATIAYDLLHVNAWLAWLDGQVPANSEGALTTIPSFFAGNLQAVNVGQKVGGYENTTGLPFSPLLLEAIDSVDAAIGAVVKKLKAKGIYNDTLIIVAAKHGQAPIDPELYAKVDPALIMNNTGVPTQWITTDDIALIFLNNTKDTTTAVANLEKIASEADIIDIFSGQQLVSIGLADEAAPRDPAVPDVIVEPREGVIYTTSTKKIAEHGGLSKDDRNVACFVSSPRLKKMVYTGRMNTTQIAPTIVEALGYSGSELKGAVAEGTVVLPGLGLGEGGWGDW